MERARIEKIVEGRLISFQAYKTLNFDALQKLHKYRVNFITCFLQRPLQSRKILRTENIRQVRLLDLMADFGVKTNAR